MSPVLQALIDKGLFDRLPVTFSNFFFEQIQEWDLLFPAERNYHERLFGLLDRADANSVEDLFAPLRAIERKMGVNERLWPRRRFSLDQVDFLNRSPRYAEWRKVIADIFGRLDPVLEAEIAKAGRPRLAIVISPADLPVGPERMWMRLGGHGKRIGVESGAESGNVKAGAKQIAKIFAESGKAPVYGSWIVEVGQESQADIAAGSVVHLSYERLQNYRARLMSEVQRLVDTEQIRGPRQLGAKLKQLKLNDSESEVARDPILAEFTRGVLLSGNGTLLINNTFVEWAAIQAIRRARPSVIVIGFGIRNKVKPFSSLLIYTDQDKASPIPTQMDTLGSYVDLEVFYQYIWQELERYAEYRRNTVYLFLAEGMDEMFVVAPPDFPLLHENGPVKISRLLETAKEWIGV
jgi:hypothetical protein